MKLSALAIRRPVTTAMFFLATGLLGLISLSRLQVELLPEVVYPEIFVALTQRAFSPEQVERQLLLPAEGEIGRLEGVVELTSNASLGRGTVQASFAPGTDMKFALLQVQSRMDRLQSRLPAQTQILVQRFDTSLLTSAVMELQVLGEGDLNWLREFTERNIRPDLEAVDGVVSAAPLGGQRRAVEILVDPDMLEAHRITLGRLRNSVEAVNRPRAYLGRVYTGNQAYPVSIQGQFRSLSQIRDVMIDATIPLRLGDIAEVRYGLQERTDLSRVNGLSSVSVRIIKEDEANLIDVSDAVLAAVERLNADLEAEGVQLLVGNNQADLMHTALGTLVQAAFAGLLLGLGVLFLFLRSLRFVAVLVVAIPTSLLLTFSLMYAGELSINVLSLCGLALATGMLADNGIVVMESIFKHFERGKSPEQAARAGTADVSRAVVASTATTVMVFLPVVFIQSDFQSILRDLSLSIAFPLLASLLVALTLVPMLGARTLARARPRSLHTGRLMQIYTVLLKTALRRRVQVSVFMGVALLVTLIAAYFLMLQQQAIQEESQFTVYVELPEGATLEATDRVVRTVEGSAEGLDGVEGFTTSVEEGQGSITVRLLALDERPDGVSVSRLQEMLAEGFDDISEAVVSYDPPVSAGGGGGGPRLGGTRGGGFSLAFGMPPELALIRGHDFATLQMIAEDLTYRLEAIEDVDVDSVQSDVQRSGPEVQIVPDPLALFDRQVQIQTVLNAIGEADVDGFATATAFLEPNGTETVIEVRPTDGSTAPALELADLRTLPILTPSGDFAPLEELARVRSDEGRRSILRTDQSRRVLVEYSFLDDVLDSQPRLDQARRVVRDMAQTLVLPEGYSIEIIEGQVDSVYYWMMGIAALLVYMVLAALFESLSSPVVVLCTLPPAAIGASWALILSGTGLTSQAAPMALLGLVVLIGIAVNNGIILIDSISSLRTRSGFRRERAVMAAGRSRVRPILMTSATTLLGVLPLALEFGGDYEIWPPFAITVLGGLSVSMLSTLLFVPVAYMGIDQLQAWLRSIGWVGVAVSTVATGAASYAFYLRYQSTFWVSLLVVPAWLLFLSTVWLALRLHRLRRQARQAVRRIDTIQLNTLTKLYGAPVGLRKEWGRFRRRTARLLAAGRDPVDHVELRQAFAWKIPLLALVGFLHTYIQDPVWLYLLAAATCVLLLNLGSVVSAVWLPGLQGSWPRAVGRALLATIFVGYVHVRLGLLSVTIASAAGGLTWRLLRWLGERLNSGKVAPEAITGLLRWPRRKLYAAVARLPIVGVRRPPFKALAGVNLEIGRGMFGLLGPNGAGKTTLMRIVCKVLKPSYGSASLDGVSLDQYGSLHGVIGYLPQRFGLYDHMTAAEYLDYRALLEGFRDRHERDERVQWCLQRVHLADRQHDLIGSYSGGMRQRVGIAQTLLHTPQVIVVDEPTAGLDPVERIRFRNLLGRLSRDRIIVFSTHIVEDIAGSCNRLAVLNEGRVLYHGTPETMRRLATGKVWEAVIPEAALPEIEEQQRVITQLRTPAGIRARFLAPEALRDLVVQAVEPTLEDAYVYLLEKQRGLAW